MAYRGNHRGRIAVIAALSVGVLLLVVLAWANRAWLPFLLEFESLGANPQGYREYRHRETGIVFVHLPGGAFLMGCSEEEIERVIRESSYSARWYPEFVRSSGPVHEVTLSAFLIAKYELTQDEWERVMGSNPSKHRGGKHPVERLSWSDCAEFCSRTGLRFPTEAQWEYACRAGTRGPYAGTGRLADMGWAERKNQSAPVGTRSPNGFGLFDMHGNVEEWCYDLFDKDFYSSPKAAGPDPVCTSSNPTSGHRAGSDYRVVRGGAFDGSAKEWSCRSGLRSFTFETDRGEVTGFRPAFYPVP